MSYLQDRKKKNVKIRNVAIVVVVLFILSYFHVSIFSGLSTVTNKVFKPMITIGNNIGSNIAEAFTFFESKQSLENENEKLRNQLIEVRLQVTNQQTLFDENESLREILDRKKESANLVLATILVKPNQSLYDTIVVDVGLGQGIAVGDLVFALGNIPIGKVNQVFNNSAKVTLFSTSGEKTEVVINGKPARNAESIASAGGDTFMQVVGRGGGNFEMILPREFELLEGTEVTLPGINSYLLAKVITIISDPRDSYKKALLVSPVNIQELKFVQVEK